MDFLHQILARSTALDDDPFPDFEYAFVTGRDGPAAARFVERTLAARQRDYGRSVRLFGTWEGDRLPPARMLSALKAMKADGEFKLVHTKADGPARAAAAKDAVAGGRGKDALLFFSHGYPDEMAGCFRAKKHLRSWKATYPAQSWSTALLLPAPLAGRWLGPGPLSQAVRSRGPAQDNLVALALLDSPGHGLVAGIDAWRGRWRTGRPAICSTTGSLSVARRSGWPTGWPWSSSRGGAFPPTARWPTGLPVEEANRRQPGPG